jgi:pimeloyl-ACP methyl ester carboxylesterase
VRLSTITDLEVRGGRRLRLRYWPGHGRPLVLLHGLFDSSEGWTELVNDTHRPAYAFDLPGFGASDLPRAPRFSSYAADIVAGIEQAGISDCTLVGHSLGGGIAAAVAERSGAVSSLALLAPVGFGPIRLADAFALPVINQLAMRALPLALASPPVVAAAYATFVSHGRWPSTDLVKRVRGNAWGASAGARAAVMAMSHAGNDVHGFHNRNIGFSGPVAALWGQNDNLVPTAHADALRLALPQAHVEIWAGMGHHPQRERPTELSRFIELRASRARRVARRSTGARRGEEVQGRKHGPVRAGLSRRRR